MVDGASFSILEGDALDVVLHVSSAAAERVDGRCEEL